MVAAPIGARRVSKLTLIVLVAVVGLGVGGCSSNTTPRASATLKRGVLAGNLQPCTAYQNPKGTDVRVFRGDVVIAMVHVPKHRSGFRFALPPGRYTLSENDSARGGEPLVVKTDETSHEDIPNFICF
jgi:hypothetical protein